MEKQNSNVTVNYFSTKKRTKAGKAIDQLTPTELNADDGMETLPNKLDSVFQSEAIGEAYNIYSMLINFSRAENVDINEYILEHEHLYKKMEDFGMKLPDAVLAFKLLDGASLSVDDQKLALALGKDMKFSDMKSALKRLFNNASSIDIPNIAINDEEAFYSKIPNRNESENISQENNNDSENTDEEINIVLFNENESDNGIFVADALKLAVIDTACTKTVAGEDW